MKHIKIIITKNQTLKITDNGNYTYEDRINLNKALSKPYIEECYIGDYHITLLN